MSTTRCDVVVIGAGISGLTAAYMLKKKDPTLHIEVLEAKDRIGGRTQTVSLKAASGEDRWDLGGQWVGRCQPHIMSLLEELGLSVSPQYIQGKKVMQIGDNSVRTYKSDIPSLSLFALIDLQLYILKIERMRKQVNTQSPWQSQHLQKMDMITMETFLQNTLWTKGARETIESAGRCMFGVEPDQLSLLFFLLYMSSGGGIKQLTEATPFSAQEYTIQGGAQQVCECLMRKIGTNTINLQQPVVSISQNDTNVTIKTTSGNTYICDRVICAVPPPALGRVVFNPCLPSAKQELIKRMPIGSIIKVIITYKEAFWRNKGYSGEAVTCGGPKLIEACDTGPLCIIYDATHATNPALVSFIGGSQAIQWSNVQASERQHCVLKQLSTFFGSEALDFVDYREKNWNTESYTEGGPVCCVTPGAMKYFTTGIRAPFSRLHFAGTETATQWCGFMSGAVQAGFRSAIEVLSEIRPDVITEDDLELCANKLTITESASKIPWITLTIAIGGLFVVGVVVITKKSNILSAFYRPTHFIK